MRWPWSPDRVPAADEFMAKLDEVIEDFDRVVAEHRRRLEELRSATRD